MKVRKVVGIGAILFMLIGVFALSQTTEPGEYHFRFEALLFGLTLTWSISSFGNKILMIANYVWKPSLYLSLVSFIALINGVWFFGECIVSYQRPWIYELLTGVWIMGWFLIDLFELIYDLAKKYYPTTTTG